MMKWLTYRDVEIASTNYEKDQDLTKIFGKVQLIKYIHVKRIIVNQKQFILIKKSMIV